MSQRERERKRMSQRERVREKENESEREKEREGEGENGENVDERVRLDNKKVLKETASKRLRILYCLTFF